MNHCYRCSSDYGQPGTCNCFVTAPLDLGRALDMARESELLRLRERDRHAQMGGCPICASGSGIVHGCIASPHSPIARGNLGEQPLYERNRQ